MFGKSLMVKKYNIYVKIIETAKNEVPDYLRSYLLVKRSPELQKIRLDVSDDFHAFSIKASRCIPYS